MDRKWIIIRIDGRIAGISTDYRMLASVSARLAKMADKVPYKEVTAVTTSFDEVWKLRQEVRWDDLVLFGTDFQKKVWRKLWDLTHDEGIPGQAVDDGKETRLVSYTDFAELCENKAGVRAVAHAIGLNPISVIIPCHLVIPKESMDKMDSIREKAEATIFKGDDLCLSSILKDESIDFGEYSLGRDLKRKLIMLEHHYIYPQE